MMRVATRPSDGTEPGNPPVRAYPSPQPRGCFQPRGLKTMAKKAKKAKKVAKKAVKKTVRKATKAKK